MHSIRRTPVLGLIACSFLASTAHAAFNPDDGAEPPPAPVMRVNPNYSSPLRPTFQPLMFSQQPAPVAMPVQPAYILPQTTYPAPQTVEAPVLSVQQPETVSPPAAYAEQPSSTPMPIAAEPAYAPTYDPQPMRNHLSFGVEGFWDRFERDQDAIENHALAGSITGDLEHRFSPEWFGLIDARLSRGSEEYASPLGKKSGISTWEFETRAVGGYDWALGGERHLKPYVGLGARYFTDNGKNKTTDLGNPLYGERAWQLYFPVGLTYEFPAWGLHFEPNIEYGYVLHGRINERSGDASLAKIDARQNDGYELRGEVMMGTLDYYGSGWQYGPFTRYWHFDDSDMSSAGSVPENDRLEIGAKLKFHY